jgi:hypothetical protein
VLVESALAAVEADDADGMIIKAMPDSRVSRAGSFLVSWKQPDARCCALAPLAKN